MKIHTFIPPHPHPPKKNGSYLSSQTCQKTSQLSEAGHPVSHTSSLIRNIFLVWSLNIFKTSHQILSDSRDETDVYQSSFSEVDANFSLRCYWPGVTAKHCSFTLCTGMSSFSLYRQTHVFNTGPVTFKILRDRAISSQTRIPSPLLLGWHWQQTHVFRVLCVFLFFFFFFSPWRLASNIL